MSGVEPARTIVRPLRPREPRYRTLDVWRGVACLFVIFYHSVLVHLNGTTPTSDWIRPILNLFGQLWIGVPLFFVISGYCIAATADGTRLRGDRLGTYFLRRFRRIYPPLWAVIVASVLFFLVVDVVLWQGLLSRPPWAQYRPWWYSASQWFGNFTLTETWRHYFFGDPRAHFPGQAWTLCYEEQFYMVVGLMLLFRRWFFSGAILVSLGTLAVVAMARAWEWPIDGFFFDGNWLMFAAGILVYYACNYASVGGQIAATIVLAMSVALAPWLAVPGSAAAFIFAASLVPLKRVDAATARSIWLAPLNYCGQMCYSLYLVHQILAKAVSSALAELGLRTDAATLLITVPVSIAVAVAAGRLFYVHVERRFLNPPAASVVQVSRPIDLVPAVDAAAAQRTNVR
ncbi:MAG TPA: acyltransferase [Vicinamibacterales bacterium]|nr:acyltransferase [Vicinamibacterales bacterium]